MFSRTVAGAKLVNSSGAACPGGAGVMAAFAEPGPPGAGWTRAKLDSMMAVVLEFCRVRAWATAESSRARASGVGTGGAGRSIRMNQRVRVAAMHKITATQRFIQNPDSAKKIGQYWERPWTNSRCPRQ